MDNKKLIDIVTGGMEYSGAYNVRINGKLAERNCTPEVTINSKTDKDGIDIIVKENVKNAVVAIPVVVSESEMHDKVYNDFFIGDNCDVVIVAGCGVDSCNSSHSSHSGIHTFYVGKNSRVKYIEKHYGHGSGNVELNPETIVHMESGSQMTFDTIQIQGVDKTSRISKCYLEQGALLTINEKVRTHNEQVAYSEFYVELNGSDSKLQLSSRAVAEQQSKQIFVSDVVGNEKCYAHVECDAIITGNAKCTAKPQIVANHSDAALVHEATIGKIAGEQLTKLLTLGLTEEQAESVIINGFLK